MKVLVFGGLGRYSVRITEKLAEEHDLTVFELKDTAASFSCDLVVGDVLDGDAVVRASEGHDAAISFIQGRIGVSIDGLRNILEGAAKSSVSRVVYTSSGGISYPIPVYDNHPTYHAGFFDAAFWESFFPIDEDFGLFPGLETSDYFFLKWLSEQVCEHYARDGLSVTAIRPGNLVWEDMTAPGSDNDKVVNPLHLLINGHATVADAAHLFGLAAAGGPDGFNVYQLSNTTAYANLSMKRAQSDLGFSSLDPQVYLDFYGRQAWDDVYREALDFGIPADVLSQIEGFRSL